MLVLSRKVGEKIIVGDNVVLEVIKIKGNRVTLGVSAPAEVKVLRSELNKHPVALSKIELVVEDGALQAC